jgi:hypothetical protein
LMDGAHLTTQPSSEDDDLWRRTNLVCMPSFLPSFCQHNSFVLSSPFFLSCSTTSPSSSCSWAT